MFSPSGSAPMATTSAPARQGGHQVFEVGLGRAGIRPYATDVRPCRPPPVLTEAGFDLVLDRVGQLETARVEELHTVVRHGVVAGREHDAQIGAPLRREERDSRCREYPEPHNVHTGTGQPGDNGGLEEFPTGPGVPPDQSGRPPGTGVQVFDHHVRSGNRKVERQLGGEVDIGDPADAVGAEQSARTAHDQRLEYWGALRAFLRPYLRRSFTRASRVRKPARFNAGRLSRSISVSAREIPRRSAPACPETPPPVSRAVTSKTSPISSVVKGSRTSCWCTLLGKYSSSDLPLTSHRPEPGISRTRAIASLRRPVAPAFPVVTARGVNARAPASLTVGGPPGAISASGGTTMPSASGVLSCWVVSDVTGRPV